MDNRGLRASRGSRPAFADILFRGAFIIMFALLFALFTVRSPHFLTGSNLVNILEGSAILLVVALALTVVVLSGGIDLSVGVALDFGAWFSVVAMLSWGLPWQLAVLCGLAGGALIGALNALLIVVLRVTPFLATLGTFFIGRSVQQIGTNGGANINHRNAPEGFQQLAGGSTLGIPNEVWIVAVIAVIFYVGLTRSTLGRRIDAMGVQDSAAQVAGLRTRRYRALVYIGAAVVASIAGIFLLSGLRIYTPLAGFSYLLDGIAAVFIGASIHRQTRPNVIGTVIGVLFLSMLNVGLDLMGIDFNTKAALRGVVLVASLALAFAVSRYAYRRATVAMVGGKES